VPTHPDPAPDAVNATVHVAVPAGDAPRLRVHAVSHTHWDREWYHDAGRFRQRLVPLIDALLDFPSGGTSFLLDGQAVLLADYLAVRPERHGLLRAQLESGAIEAGPWYVLADSLIPSGEAIIRNLESGRRVLTRHGAVAPRVAYCPDTFGHPAMMPAIAAGFGLPVAIVWRGLGGEAHPPSDAVRWRGPDGSSVLAYHLPPDGYEVGSALPTDAPGATARWARLAATWRVRNRTGVVLLPNGADHHARQRGRDDALRLLARAAAADGAILIDSSLARFADALVHSATAALSPLVEGELRDSYGYTWTLQGTFGTRAHQKRANARLERALLRDVEPWLVLAWLHGDAAAHVGSPDARLTLAQLPSLLHHAWETLLRTHPHDTLCGCSTDDVALAMEARQRAVATQALGIREGALQLALGHDPAIVRSSSPLAHPPVVVRNRAGYARGGIAELRLVETIADVRVGPRSANANPLRATRNGDTPALGDILLQAGRSRLSHTRRESPQHYPDDDLVRVHHVVAWVPSVPANGLRVLGGGPSSTTGAEGVDQLASPPVIPGVPLHPASLIQSDASVVIDNGIVRVTCDAAGVHLQFGGRLLARALTLESQVDAGDSYTPSLRGLPRELQLVSVRAGAPGPLRASIRLRWKLALDITPSGDDFVPSDIQSMTVDPTAGQRANGSVVVETELILDADANHLRCDVHGVNLRRDHRLRLRWNTDLKRGTVHADAAFGPVRREPIVASRADSAVEAAPATMPMHRWVALSDDTHGEHSLGATLISDGLAEAEVTNGQLSVTLLRAIGELSRADLPERPGHAGWPCPTPRSQSKGRFRARIGLLLHGAWSDNTIAKIEDSCDTLLLPLTGETWRDLAAPPLALAGPTLTGVGLRASAVTLSADGRSLLLRVTNITDTPVVGAWQMPTAGPWHVTRCRLDEAPLSDAEIVDVKIPLQLSPRALHTLLISRA